jgi:hypothetical protein
MGLDMYLDARKYVSSYSDPEEYEELKAKMGLSGQDIPEASSGSISLGVMYWRKANAVHDWFVREIQNGEDDCKTYYVERGNLIDLLELCQRVVASQGDDGVLAAELLPTTSGFFFGSTDYDEYYYQDLLWTIEGLERILKNPAYERMDFHYHSSW